MSVNVIAQEPMHKRKPVTYEQVTKTMVKELQLDEKQQKKVAKLNKKYKTLIEGEQREAPGNGKPKMGERPAGAPPSGGMPGGHASENSYDYDKKQKKYDKVISKILTEKQMEGYQEIKSHFASQRRVRDFLFGASQDFNRYGED